MIYAIIKERPAIGTLFRIGHSYLARTFLSLA